MLIREIRKEDARRVVDFLNQLDRESNFLLYDPGEREKDEEKHVKEFETLSEDGSPNNLPRNETAFHCRLFIDCTRGSSIEIDIQLIWRWEVLKKYQGQGIGTKLLRNGKEWAKKTRCDSFGTYGYAA